MMPRGGRCLTDSHCESPTSQPPAKPATAQAQLLVMNRPDNSLGIEVLTEVINQIKDRIRQDQHVARNETRTRNALIDPILHVLGWDPTDPKIVIPEYQVNSGVVDYALLGVAGQPGSAVAFIEAKRMTEDLSDEHRAQLFRYVRHRKSVNFAGLTNGDLWEMYEISQKTNPRMILRLSISSDPVRDCAQELQKFFSRLPITTTDQTPREPRRENAHWNSENTLVREGRDSRAELAEERFIQAKNYQESPEPKIRRRQRVGFDPNKSEDSRAYRGFSKRDSDASHNSPNIASSATTILGWLGIAVVICGLIGYVTGFRAAQPVFGIFGIVGSIVVGTVALAGTTLILQRLSWAWVARVNLSPANTNKLRLLGITAVGALTSGGIGYVVGTRTAQDVVDLLDGIGLIVTAFLVAVFLILVAIATVSKSKK